MQDDKEGMEMLYISKEGEVLSTDSSFKPIVELYDSWKTGLANIEISTSGSTGTPKIISLSREAISASIMATQEAFGLDQETFFLCNLNTDYIGGKMMVLRAAEIGCDLLVTSPTSNPFENLERQRYLVAQNWGKNFFSFVPLQLKNVLESEQHIQLLRTAKAILVGGAAVSEDIIQKVRHHHLPVYETYGMTETVSHIAIRDLRENDDFFTTLKGVEIDIDNENCLKVKSASTNNQWITTNDVVEVLTNTTFLLKGRRDNIINSGGVKIQLEEVEKTIAKNLETPVDFFVYGIEDDILGQKLVLVSEKQKINIEDISQNLPKYHVPKENFVVDEFAKTPSGKIDKTQTIAKVL